MAITFPSNTDTTLFDKSVVTGTTVTFSVPTGVSTGDHLMVIDVLGDYNRTWSTPATVSGCTAWTEFFQASDGQDALSEVAVFWCQVTDASTASGETVSVVASGPEYHLGLLMVIQGAHDDFEDVTWSESSHFSSSTSNNAPQSSAITTATAGAAVISFVSNKYDSGQLDTDGTNFDVDPPSGYTIESHATPGTSPGSEAEGLPGRLQINTSDGYPQFSWAHKTVATAGTETPGAWSGFINSYDWMEATFAIKPAGEEEVATDAVGVTDSTTYDHVYDDERLFDPVGVTDSVSAAGDAERSISEAVGVTDSVEYVLTTSDGIAYMGYFDASDAGPNVMSGTWSSPANAFDHDVDTDTTQTGGSTGAINATGTSFAGYDGGTVRSVEVRWSEGPTWSSWEAVDDATGGWTVAKVQGLYTILYSAATDTMTTWGIYVSQGGQNIGPVDFGGADYVSSLEVRVIAYQDELEISDATGVTDSVSTVLTEGDPEVTEPVGVTDSVAPLGFAERSEDEAVGVVDATSAVKHVSPVVVDGVGVSDSVSVVASMGRSIVDAVGVTDSTSEGEENVEAVVEAVGVTDTVDVLSTTFSEATDSVGVTDSVTQVVAHVREVADTVGVEDDVYGHVPGSGLVTEAVGLTDSVTWVKTIVTSVGADEVLPTAELLLQAENYSGSGDWLDESGNGHDAQFGDGSTASTYPTHLPYTDTKYLYTQDNTTTVIYTADNENPDLSDTDYDIRVYAAVPDWETSALNMVSAWGAQPERAWLFGKDVSGHLFMQSSTTGYDSIKITSTNALPAAWDDYGSYWLRVICEWDNWQGRSRYHFYYSTNGSSWTSLNDDQYSASTVYMVSAPDAPVAIQLRSDDKVARPGKDSIVQIYTDLTETTLVFDSTLTDLEEPFSAMTEDSSNEFVLEPDYTTGHFHVVDQPAFVLHEAEYFEIADAAGLDFAASEPFTVLVSARLSPEFGATTPTILSKLGTGAGWQVAYDDSSGNYWYFTTSDGTVDVDAPVTVRTDEIYGTLTAVAGVRDVTADTVEAFLVGDQKGDGEDDDTTTTLANSEPLRIGATAGTASQFFDGEIHGVAIWDDSLSLAELAQAKDELAGNGPDQIDTIGVTDEVTYLLGDLIAIADPVGVEDSVSTIAGIVRSITDDVGVSDDTEDNYPVFTAVVEGVGVTDSVDVAVSKVRSVTDAVGVEDSTVDVRVGAHSDEAVGVTDSVLTVKSVVVEATDAVGVEDSMVDVLDVNDSPIDDLGITDTVERAQDVVRLAAESVGATDSVEASKAILVALTDSVGVGDALDKSVSVDVVDAVGVADSVSEGEDNVEAVVEAVGVTDEVAVLRSPSVDEAVGATDSISAVKAIAQAITEAVGVTDVPVRDEVGASVVSDVAGVTDTVSVVKTVERAITEPVGIIDFLPGIGDQIEAVVEGAAVTDAVSRVASAKRVVSEDAELTDAIAAAKAIVVEISDSVGVEDTEAATKAAFAEIVESLNVADPVVGGTSFARNIVEGVSVADGSAFDKRRFLVVVDAVGVTDSLVSGATVLPLRWTGGSMTSSSTGGSMTVDATGSSTQRVQT